MSKSFLEPAQWYATLPAFYASACALLTDTEDRVLMVKPNYRPHWAFPGGIMEADELPHECAVREVGEELGLRVAVTGLLVVDWALPVGDRPQSMINFVFDGGTVTDPGQIVLQTSELDDFGFFPWDEAARLLPAATAPRIPAARRARDDARTIYLPFTPQ
ncbi:NUDIX domain-containing protein [Nonomuraea angiospora]|uniref:8-oxo-dGTP pyrophosphatase MutT (NUDIX family) n=1 Tax=Nonomuraea angiospora TaxID=46172 RepID=A0ABR9LUK5_9ACTN|nr:NUDIX hydrolase [Nonomuraea angiospora]MBE1584333.1 8-oxo-dGTP pyrophosphatase MutT (NUDIX family) [Nonomuraea angiospora]